MQPRDVYSQTVHIGGASPREAEMLAFGLCNTRLRAKPEGRGRIDALNKTHQLWSLLVRDLASEGNGLPIAVKQELIQLGFWAMHYSVLAMGQDLDLRPLIEVNQNIADGLGAQVAPIPGQAVPGTVHTISAHA